MVTHVVRYLASSGMPRCIPVSRRPSTPGQNRASDSSVLARNPLLLLVPLLRFDGHCRDRPRFEAREGNRLTGHFAKAIFAVLDSPQGRVDLGNQLTLAIAGAQLDRPIGLARSPIREVRLANWSILELGHR